MNGTGAGSGPAGLGSRRYRRMLALAAAALLWERAWPRLWPAACILGTFVAIALFDLLPALPAWLHAATLAAFALALATALARAWPALRPPGHAAARLRLERDNRLQGRPLATLEDQLAAGDGDPLAQALWERHRQRMQAVVQRLRVRLPRPEIARHEPWGVRAAVVLLLAVALVAGRDDVAARLLRALDPGLHPDGTAMLVEVWITPPAYTAQRPIFLRANPGGGAAPSQAARDAEQPVSVPRGSAVLARVDGPGRPPTLAVEGGGDATFVPLAGEGDGRQAWRAETTIEGGRHIAVRLGRRLLASWPIAVAGDDPPRVALAEPPAAGGDGLLKLAYRAEDDYGVAELEAAIEPLDPAAAGPPQEFDARGPVRLPLPVPVPASPAVEGAGLQDLAASPMAGERVRVRLQAKDGAGQEGVSDWAETVLPERTFTHPVARALIDLRKRLFRAPRQQRGLVAQELAALADHPERFSGDVVVSLALAVAAGRLRLERAAAAVASVRDLMWDTALRIDQGDVPFAERQLDRARQALIEALQQRAPDARIEQLMDALQEALAAYLAAAAAEAGRRGEARLQPQVDMLHAQDLHDLIETAREMMRVGGRDAAMQMLGQLQRVLDGLRAGLRASPDPSTLAQANALMQSLRELAARQQALADEAFRQQDNARDFGMAGARTRDGPIPLQQTRPDPRRSGSRPGSAEQEGGAELGSDKPGAAQPGATPGGARPGRRPGGSASRAGGGDAAAEQRALRDALGTLMPQMQRFLGNIPAPVDEAHQDMRGAVDYLARGRPDDALPAQVHAADALHRALADAAQAMAEMLGGMISLPGGEGEGEAQAGDIFGRRPDGRRGFASGPLTIPDHSSLQRAREIVDELRRRAAERSRPRPELDYIERLLQTF